MKNLTKAILLLFVTSITSVPTFAQENKWEEILSIAKQTDPKAGRCVKDREIPEPKCKAQQEAMIKTGCVKKEHVKFIKDNGIFPLCDIEDNPASACFCGCFAAGTRILARNIETKIHEWVLVEDLAKTSELFEIFALDEESRLSKVTLVPVRLHRVTSGPEHKPLVVLSTSGAERIRLSEEHAVLLATGRMVEAVEIKLGDELLDLAGNKKEVVSIEREEFSGLVYNFVTQGTNLKQHIVVAEGLLMGDLRWQSSLPMDNHESAISK